MCIGWHLRIRDASNYDVIDLVSSDEEVVEEEPTIAPLDEEEEVPPLEDEEEEVEEEELPIPPLEDEKEEVEEEQEVLVGPTEGVELLQGGIVPMHAPGVTVEPSSGLRRGRDEDGGDVPTLRCVFPRTSLAGPRACTLPRFALHVGPSAPFANDTELNHPGRMDLDAACFCMLTRELSDLFGIMARLANRLVKIRDLVEFSDWLHVMSDPIVVRVYAGRDREERDSFRADLVEMLRILLGLTLTCSTDSYTLSRNQVNVSVSAMSQALGARICRVSFFGIKWRFTEAKPILDGFIDR